VCMRTDQSVDKTEIMSFSCDSDKTVRSVRLNMLSLD